MGRWWTVSAAMLALACVDEVPESGRMPPCAPGWYACAESNVCVEDDELCPECKDQEVCGDGVVCGQEVCDDGDVDNCTPECNADCTGTVDLWGCGDGHKCGDETCDDGDNDNCTAECDSGCFGPVTLAGCRDGYTCGDEACDPGVYSDLCNEDCEVVPKLAAAGTDSAGGFTCLLGRSRQVHCWGAGSPFEGLETTLLSENLGDEPGEMDALPPIVGSQPVVDIVAHGDALCLHLDSGHIQCSGPVTKIPEPAMRQLRWRSFDFVGFDLCGTRADEAFVCADLGSGRGPRMVRGGLHHWCALFDYGNVKCWGENSAAQLGLGDNRDRGGNPDDMGNNLPFVDLGGIATHLEAGDSFTCALGTDGLLRCWGSNSVGQLGRGDAEPNVGDDEGEMGANLLPVDLGDGIAVTQFGLGSEHACALLFDGRVKCWGGNDVGQLGLGNTTSLGRSAESMGANLSPVDLGSGRTAVALAVGPKHNCAVLDNDTIKCWGDNGHGQLGLGDSNHRGDEPGEMGDALQVTPVALD